MKYLFHCFTFLLLFIHVSKAQDFPPINTFEPKEYNAGNQSWMIDQDENGTLYFANNDGLLVYNGAYWDLYPSPNNSIIRSVKVIGDRIYTGCYMEFGYWEKTKTGKLAYTSLAARTAPGIIEDEQFWNISYEDPFILFQSLNRILIYHTETGEVRTIDAPNGITRMFTVNNTVYYHSYGAGLFRISKGRAEIVSGDERLKNSRIATIIPGNTHYTIITQQNGIYQLDAETGDLEQLPPPEPLQATGIYSAIALGNGHIAIGTISQGLFITDSNLAVLYHIDQSNGLSNNTVLSLSEDMDHNLWLGLDNGINCINLQAPFRRYLEQNGKIGTVYTAAKKDNILYLGTNQGLFYKRDNDASFQLVKGTKSQVWSLFEYDNTLFCGHDAGTFVINQGVATLISDIPGTWDFRPVPGHEDLILQGNYNGFNILKKENGTWRFLDHIRGFDYSSKHFEITRDLRIYMSHEYKGVFELEIDTTQLSVKKFKRLAQPEKGKNSGLTKFEDQIYYANLHGVYKVGTKQGESFQKDSILSELAGGENYVSGKMINDRNGNLWLFTRENLLKVNPGELSTSPRITKIPIPYNEVRTISGYEHVLCTGNDSYLVGSKDGYLTFDMNKVEPKEYEITIEQITNSHPEKNDSLIGLHEAANLDYKNNNIAFRFSVPEYQKYSTTRYQYHLSGQLNTWSPWSEQPEARFENLPYGRYTFKVRAKIGNKLSANVATFNFEVLPPWYLSRVALAVYLLLLVAGAFIINGQYKRYYKKQQQRLLKKTEEKHRLEQLENEQELVKLRNEKLQQDVASKNRELAASTMNIIKKNEFLIEIRDNLKQLNGNSEKQLKTLIRDINKDINEEDNWNMFKEAFNNADKDFLKKVKSLHPNLTPNDLRLCAYLRLNLSSKEIAPLLNISVRSVEIKRYRLRKKMELEHEKSLVEYILSV